MGLELGRLAIDRVFHFAAHFLVRFMNCKLGGFRGTDTRRTRGYRSARKCCAVA